MSKKTGKIANRQNKLHIRTPRPGGKEPKRAAARKKK